MNSESVTLCNKCGISGTDVIRDPQNPDAWMFADQATFCPNCFRECTECGERVHTGSEGDSIRDGWKVVDAQWKEWACPQCNAQANGVRGDGKNE